MNDPVIDALTGVRKHVDEISDVVLDAMAQAQEDMRRRTEHAVEEMRAVMNDIDTARLRAAKVIEEYQAALAAHGAVLHGVREMLDGVGEIADEVRQVEAAE